MNPIPPSFFVSWFFSWTFSPFRVLLALILNYSVRTDGLVWRTLTCISFLPISLVFILFTFGVVFVFVGGFFVIQMTSYVLWRFKNGIKWKSNWPINFPYMFAGIHDDGSQAVLKYPETSFESALTSFVSFRYDLKHFKILN